MDDIEFELPSGLGVGDDYERDSDDDDPYSRRGYVNFEEMHASMLGG